MSDQTDSAHIYLSLIIPAYNEQDRVESRLAIITAYISSLPYSVELILVNDGSTDSTGEILAESAAANSAVRVVSYSPNRGKGFAVRQGVFASCGEYIAFSDADLSTPIDELAALFKAIEDGFDIAIGSRSVKGAQIKTHQPFYREFGGKSLNLLIRMFAVRGIMDTQCGFKLFRGDVAREIFGRCFLNGWAFDVEVLYLAQKMGCCIAETPVKWAHSEGSKVRPLQAGMQVIRDIARIRMHNYGSLGVSGFE